MCRYFVMFKGLTQFSKWAYLSASGYHRKCKDKTLSSGVVQVGKNHVMVNRNVPALMCLKNEFALDPATEMVFYHTRVPFDGKTDSVKLVNTHPFLFDNDRFIAMHNGLIKFKPHYKKQIKPEYATQIQGDTDSERFFALWLSFGVEDGFYKALEYVQPDSTMNLVLYDRVKNELYIYRSKYMHKLVPPVYVSENGFSNFKTPDSKTIQKGSLIRTTIS